MKLVLTKKDFLAIILLIMGLIFFISPFNQAEDLKTLHEKTFKVTSGGKLNLSSSSGDIYINVWDQNEAKVIIKCNDNAKEKMKFMMELSGNELIVKGERINSMNWFSNLKVKYYITLPKNFNSLIKTAGGDINIKELSGDFEIKTSGGDIDLVNTKGKMELKTSGGDIKVLNTAGEIKAVTSGGDIKLKTSNSKIDATTSGGDIEVYYSGENKGIELSTSGGDVDVLVDKNVKAKVELKTSGGDVEADISTTRVYSSSSRKFEAEGNGGGELIKCMTSGGDITFKGK